MLSIEAYRAERTAEQEGNTAEVLSEIASETGNSRRWGYRLTLWAELVDRFSNDPEIPLEAIATLFNLDGFLHDDFGDHGFEQVKVAWLQTADRRAGYNQAHSPTVPDASADYFERAAFVIISSANAGTSRS